MKTLEQIDYLRTQLGIRDSQVLNDLLNDYDRLTGDLTLENIELKQEIERLNNDIKELLKENSSKEKVIKIQDNIISKAIEYIETENSIDNEIEYTTRLLDILRGEDNESK